MDATSIVDSQLDTVLAKLAGPRIRLKDAKLDDRRAGSVLHALRVAK